MNKQLIYTVWIIKNNKCICDGCTEAMNPLDLVQSILILGGVLGLIGAVYYKLTGFKNRWF